LANCSPGKQQIRNVGAGDEQNESDCAEQYQQRRLDVTYDLFSQ